MTELWQPTRRMYVDIIGGELDGLVIDTNISTPLERHFWAMMESLEVGKTIETIKLLDSLSLLQNHRQAIDNPKITEEYTVVAREESDQELLIQLRHRYQKQDENKVGGGLC